MPSEETLGTDRFEVLRRLGSGGMGVVYEVVDRELGGHVALKTLSGDDSAGLFRFKQEFRSVEGLHHENLVRLYELFAEEGQWFFTMELVDGVELHEFVRGRTSRGEIACEPGTAIDAAGSIRLHASFRQLASGLVALHAVGKVHRDIKPSNVLVEPNGRVVVLDLGLAVGLKRPEFLVESTAEVSGTIAYMAPEQLMGGELSDRADTYAVGVMLYECLTGEKPYGTSVNDIVSAMREGEVARPSDRVPEIPAELDELCSRLLQVEATERPSAAELERTFSESSEQPEVHAAPTVRTTTVVSVDETPFFGRERELDVLAGAFDKLRSGRPIAVHLHGESGSGKSMLARRFLESLGEVEEEVVVLAGRCYEAESVPYKALDSLIDELSRYLRSLPDAQREAVLPRGMAALTRVFPVLERIGSDIGTRAREVEVPNQRELRRRAFEALAELLGRLGDRRLVVLVIDDLHWGDVDSAQLLLEMLGRDEPPAVLLMNCFRSAYRNRTECLRMLLGDDGLAASVDSVELEVERFDLEDAADYALSILGADDPDSRAAARAAAEESSGNPYLLQELVQAARVAGQHAADADMSLDEVLWRRVQSLPDEAFRLLRAICVAGQPIERADAASAAELSGDSHEPLSRLRTERLISSVSLEHVEPYHDRVRESCVAHLEADTREDEHRRLASVLEAAGSYDPEMVAGHFLGSGQRERAGLYYEKAAVVSEQALAFERAAQLYETSLELRELEPADRGGLLERQAAAMANAGRSADAAAVYESALDGAEDETTSLRRQRQAAFHYCVSGRVREGEAALDALLASQGMKRPRTPAGKIAALLYQRARLRLRGLDFVERDASEVSEVTLARIDATWAASAGISMFDIVQGASFQARNLVAALRAGEPQRIARSLAWEAAHKSNDGGKSWSRTQLLLRKSNELSDRLATPQTLAMAKMGHGIAMHTMGRWRDAVPLLDEAIEVFDSQCTGVTWETDTAQAFMLWASIYAGDFPRVCRRTGELLEEAEARQDLYAMTNLGTYMVQHVRMAQDDPDGAEERLEHYQQGWNFEGFHLQHLTTLMSRTLIDLYRGEGHKGYARLQEQWSALKASQMLRVQVLDFLMHHFRARCALAAAAADPSDRKLLAVAARDARRIEKQKMPWGNGLAAMVRGGIAALRGDLSQALEHYARAAHILDEVGMASYAATACRRHGELLGGDEGAQRIASADAWFESHAIRNPAAMACMHMAPLPNAAIA